jgi:hypothetical protein
MIFTANKLGKISRTSGANYSDFQTSVLPSSHCSWISASAIRLPTTIPKARRVLEIGPRIRCMENALLLPQCALLLVKGAVFMTCDLMGAVKWFKA